MKCAFGVFIKVPPEKKQVYNVLAWKWNVKMEMSPNLPKTVTVIQWTLCEALIWCI